MDARRLTDDEVLCCLEVRQVILLAADKGLHGRNTITLSEIAHELDNLAIPAMCIEPLVDSMIEMGLLAIAGNATFTVTPEGRKAIN